MTLNVDHIFWFFTVLLFHVAVTDRQLSSRTETGGRVTGESALESKAAAARRFQHWSIFGGKDVQGEFATIPGAFKYSAVVDVRLVRCSGSIISRNFVLTSTQCYVSKKANKNTRIGQKEDNDKAHEDVPNEHNTPIGWAMAGGVNYRTEADIVKGDVQLLRLDSLLLYTETHTDADLLEHDTMLAGVARPGFKFNSYVQPIRFTNQRRFSTSQPATCIVVGFGGDNFETITMANLLPKCPNGNGIDNVVCADEFRWPCMGDAGAPLVCRNLLIGTLRKQGLLPNDRCGRRAGAPEPGVQNFTFVGYYRDWIVEHASVRFGVWRSGSPGLRLRASGCRAAALVLHIWMYIRLK